MSIFSDHECGAMSDIEFRNACIQMNNREIVEEQERIWAIQEELADIHREE